MSKNCSACEALKEYAPNFVTNGITAKECKSLRKDTGLNPDLKVLHDNCEDLNDLLECLIGSLHDKLDAADDCNWKDYIDDLMTNLELLEKAIICNECGQWDYIHKIIDWINGFGGCESTIQTETQLWRGSVEFSSGSQHTFSGLDISRYDFVALEWNYQKPDAGPDYMVSEVRRVQSFPNPKDSGWFIETSETKTASDLADDPTFHILTVGAQALEKDTIYTNLIKYSVWLSNGTRKAQATTANLIGIKGYKTIKLCPPAI